MNGEKKRICLFALCNPPPAKADYLLRLLEGISLCMESTVVIAGSAISPGVRKLIAAAVDHIVWEEGPARRKWAAGLRTLEKSDYSLPEEIVLMDDGFYGPVFPLEEMFAAMSRSEKSLWGLAGHMMSDDRDSHAVYPGFLVLRQSRLLEEQWELVTGKNRGHDPELPLSEELIRHGVEFDHYAGTTGDEGYVQSPLMEDPLALLEKRRAPLLPRSLFYRNHSETIYHQQGFDAVRVLNYLEENQLYDTSFIWDNLLETRFLEEIKNALNLTYVLPDGKAAPKPDRKIVLFAHLYYPDLLDESFDILANMPLDADIIITVSSEGLKELVELKLHVLPHEMKQVRMVPARGRSEAALLLGCRDIYRHYDLMCVFHDKKSRYCKPYRNGREFAAHCASCILGGENYIENIMSTFDRNPRLGMLAPPVPAHGSLINVWGNESGSNAEKIRDLATRLELTVPFTEDDIAIAPLGGMFWCRPEAVGRIMDYPWQEKDFPEEPVPMDGTLLHAIERIYPLVVQQEGFYTGWVMPSGYAAQYITNLSYLYRNSIQDRKEKKEAAEVPCYPGWWISLKRRLFSRI